MPWKYEVTVMDKESEEGDGEKRLEVIDANIMNIVGTSRRT